jgi:hypothetical protein
MAVNTTSGRNARTHSTFARSVRDDLQRLAARNRRSEAAIVRTRMVSLPVRNDLDTKRVALSGGR